MGGWLVGNVTAGVELRLTWQDYPQSVGDVVRWSGYGPTRDGRIKPDVIAPGYDIVSAKAVDGITGVWWGWWGWCRGQLALVGGQQACQVARRRTHGRHEGVHYCDGA